MPKGGSRIPAPSLSKIPVATATRPARAPYPARPDSAKAGKPKVTSSNEEMGNDYSWPDKVLTLDAALKLVRELFKDATETGEGICEQFLVRYDEAYGRIPRETCYTT